MSAHICFVQIILQWLAGSRNFTVGVTLYESFGSNEAVKNLLSIGETDFSKKLLIEELEKLASAEISIPASTPQPKEIDEVMPPGDHDVLAALRNEWLPLYQRMNYLRHELDKAFDNNDSSEAEAYRYQIAEEVILLEKECLHIWAKRDHFLKEGKLPFEAENELVIPTDPVDLARLINNIRRNIRRNRFLLQEHPAESKYAYFYNNYKKEHKKITGKDYEEKD